MKQRDFLLYGLDSTYDKESWYAPLKEAVTGLTAGQAMWKPSGEAAKSIWENVNHLVYYKERMAATLEGREWAHHLDGDETFTLTDQKEQDQEWIKVVERAENAQQLLRQAVSTLSESDIERLERKLLDIMLHDAYHTGQIIQLRKMQGSWPSHR
ncbi:DinB family protein [Bacillus sp. Marseille-Q1617]|uniref:DinB family protein n=1 Tax=Bacillus sp. Marseille-Q1617 TaxID=2736887 RepID=UPI00158E5BA1|nr:DinB family protein [Bacillus sp. Marseille-Q1617]